MSGFGGGGAEYVPRIVQQQQQQQQQQQAGVGVMSPSIARFAQRDSSSMPYWSPQTRGSGGAMGNGGGPGGDFSLQSASGMNSTAAAWVPGQAAKPKPKTAAPAYGAGAGAGAGGGIVNAEEPMVEVTVNGSTFFVPESMAAAAQEGQMGVDLDDGLSFWTNGSTTLPAPPKRSLQTIGIPDPIRQHFQTLDIEALRQMSPDDERYKEMPNRYHSAFALDDPYSQAQRGSGGSYGYPSSVYKVVDGLGLELG